MLDLLLRIALYAYAVGQAGVVAYFGSRVRTVEHQATRRVLYILTALHFGLVLVLVAAGRELP